MLLSILIPTYNRSQELKKNLHIVSKIIEDNNLNNDIEIIVFDNASQDETKKVVSNYPNVQYYCQERNVGFEQNVLSLISVSSAEYVMLIGDDDFISEGYLLKVFEVLVSDKSLTYVVGNYYGKKPDGTLTQVRDKISIPKFYKKGIDSCVELTWRAHQVSGLTFKREGLVEYYHLRGFKTLYPQIVFAVFCTLSGNSCHITESPIEVSAPTQEKKDWSYGKTGLFDDILGSVLLMDIDDHYKKILQCNLLEEFFNYRFNLYTTHKRKMVFLWNNIVGSHTLKITKFLFLKHAVIYYINCLKSKLRKKF